MKGTCEEKELTAIEKSYYQACRNYLQKENHTVEDWAAYKSRLSAVGLLVDKKYTPSIHPYLDDTDGVLPQSLKQLEKDSFIKIIMGEEPVSYFDTFVEQWYLQGGRELTEQIQSGRVITLPDARYRGCILQWCGQKRRSRHGQY